MESTKGHTCVTIAHTFVYLLFCFADTFSANPNYTIAIVNELGNSMEVDIQQTGPAFELGIEAIQEMVGDRLNLDIIKAYMKQGHLVCTDIGYGSKVAELYYKHNVNGIIGPGCSAAVEVIGKMLSDWDIPILTEAGISAGLADKSIFSTLTRMAYNMHKFGSFYLKVLNYFNWTDISILYEEEHFPAWFLADSTKSFMHNTHINVRLLGIEFIRGTTRVREMLKAASEVSRIITILATSDRLREFMLVADELGMTNGEYAFIVLRLFEGDTFGKLTWKRGDSNDNVLKKAYEAVMIIQCRTPTGEKFETFDKEVKIRAMRDYNFDWGDRSVHIFVTTAYDSFLLYGHALNDTLNDGEDLYDGRNIIKHMWGRTFEGITRIVAIDEYGERDADFALMDITDPESGEFREAANYLGDTKIFSMVPGLQIHWPNEAGPPLNEPRCGFTGEAKECQSSEYPLYAIIAMVFGCLLLIMGIIGGMIYRKMRLEAEIQSQWWKIKWEDIIMQTPGQGSHSNHSRSRLSGMQSVHSQMWDNKSKRSMEQIFADVGVYKGVTVAVKKLYFKHIIIERETAIELKVMRDINTSHMTKLYGVCIDDPDVYIITEYCSRGSLQDILQNESLHLDREFKISLVSDIVQGVYYIHHSHLMVHGRLNSCNCVIDSRFVLKLTDFGLSSLRRTENMSNKNMKNYQWISPEHLISDPQRDISQAGDVYSFGIILYEMLTRKDPYEDYNPGEMGLTEILQKVKNCEYPPFRPMIPSDAGEAEIVSLMKICWDDNPQKRPSFSEIRRMLKAAKWDISGVNVFDTLLSRMEQYANNLEGLVEERTQAFLEEKKKSETLLYHILPRSVADKLKNGATVAPEAYDSVTIYFSDIVGFTNLSASSTPLQIVDLLNDLYTCFDHIIEHFDVYKVETIGDAYMVVSGLPNRNGTEHARQIAFMSLSIRDNLQHFNIRHKPNETLRARIGLHSGSVVAGVVGLKMPRYCLFGDTVNTASRMESNGEALRIHMSETTKIILDKYNDFNIDVRGDLEIKGKGKMTTYWLSSDKKTKENTVVNK